jgi:ribosome biogenesis GTPase
MYNEIGCRAFIVSAHNKTGISKLASFLKNKVSIVVGQSGVGKSSLINTLLPGTQTDVGHLSPGTDKGTHTTTASRLFHIPTGGELIDSPGIREFHLGHIDKDELIHYFVDIRPYLGHCKFRNCRHNDEQGCAIQQAIAHKKISPSRINSYHRIYASLTND